MNNQFAQPLLVIIFSLFLLACGGSDSPEQDVSPVVVVEPMISQFSFLTENNPSLSSNLNLSISGKTITGNFPVTADWQGMIPTVEHTGESLIINDIAQTNSVSVQDFRYINTYTVMMEDGRQVNYSVDVVAFTGLPIIYLNTSGDAPIDSKEDYIDGTVNIKGGRDFNNAATVDMKIRGRGNSTWFLHPKKPFQMKLEKNQQC